MAEHIVCSDERYHLHDAGRPSVYFKRWSVSFLELAFYFGCPGVNAFGGFVTLVHFVEGKSYECIVYHGDGRGEGIPVRADFVAQEGTPTILQVLVEYSDAVAECVAVGFGVAATE